MFNSEVNHTLVTIGSVIALALAAWWGLSRDLDTYQEVAETPQDPPPKQVQFVSLENSLTFIADTGHRIRLLGIRPPTEDRCFGQEAKQSAETALNVPIRLEIDPLFAEQTEDGAWLRYVHMFESGQDDSLAPPEEAGGVQPDAEPKEFLLNERYIETGRAFPHLNEDFVYGKRILAATRFASATKKGLWGACEIEGSGATLNTNQL